MLNARLLETLTNIAMSSASDNPYAVVNEWLAHPKNAYATATDDEILWVVKYVTDILKIRTTSLCQLLQ